MERFIKRYYRLIKNIYKKNAFHNQVLQKAIFEI